MKRNTKYNQGFSMVELIVVIAIMAVLAGALAPMLIRYVNKARLSSDIDSGKELAKAMITVMTEDKTFDDAVEHEDPYPVDMMDGTEFRKQVFALLGRDSIKGKSKKDVDGNKLENGSPQFYYTLDEQKCIVEMYYGGKTSDYQIYPIVGNKLMK